MNKIIKIALLGSFLPLISFAQININIPPPSSSATSIMAIIKALLENAIMPIAAVLVVMYIIYAGFTYVTAQGNPKKIEEANSRLLWSLIGAGVLLGAVAISGTVCTTLKAILGNTGICA
ncbi:MAG: hypothetical protein WAW92_01630 [Minisyncoccia bacterium]